MQLSVVAVRLAALRAECGLSMASAAQAAGLNTSTIFRIEHGLVAPRESTVRILLDLYGEGEHVPRLLSLLREERVPGWYDAPGVPLRLSEFLELESRAQVIYTYGPRTVPPLLQTPAYAEAAVRSALPPGTPFEQVERGVELVARRQEGLDRHEGPHLWAVLDRQALLDPPLARPDDRLAQLDALALAAKQPHIAVQIARPGAETGHLYQGPPFTLLRFADPARPDVLVLHLLHAPMVVEDRRRVEDHQQAFARLSLTSFAVDATPGVLDGIRALLPG
ncbi:Scr1 family TA system antitoxin-like transcriptional regulator [Nonomuraea jiangxiensis]|uniref:Helix-turn-helix domain-containing protein n=1 Tax=Nonomuraea jiangxiensis TaxID=633440 RepID=A0A1G9DK35_9ACTN|nr:Scr1 family TA system antitoxin-like transcriptional regulator [Nonomuraea jiangxiensis]SDK64216.1 Helix-turn-helix domain-containing protein [Nonomuraea jiangxiensis]